MKYLSILFSFVMIVSCKHSKKTTHKKDQNPPRIEAKVLESVNLSSGKLIRVDSFPSKYITPRPVDVWLPQSYSIGKKYAVLYMHDGQMLFDASSTWNKQEWKVDEVASKLMEKNVTRDFIVVAIHNIATLRWLDLYPEKSTAYLAKKDQDSLTSFSNKKVSLDELNGNEYLKFLVEELKPYIDETYSVFTNKENTFVGGSSMGGLMSMYAISEYPEIFQGAACISTHWVGALPKENNPLPHSIFAYLKKNLPDSKTHKVYFDYGNKTLDQYYPPYASSVDSIFLKAGYSGKNYRNLFFEGTSHAENSWQERIEIPLTFLLKK